jgi:protein involved in sex pheromone biosynthesis
MKKTLLILLTTTLLLLTSCSKECQYNKAELDKMFESEIKSAGNNWQKVDLIIQKYNLKYKDAC